MALCGCIGIERPHVVKLCAVVVFISQQMCKCSHSQKLMNIALLCIEGILKPLIKQN